MNILKKLTITTFIAATMLFPASVSAQTESSILFVAPHRVIIEDGQDIEVLNVANKSNEERRYDLTVVNQVMNEQGLTQRLDTFEYSAARFLRYVPKRFSLKPGERQIVRVMVRRPSGLEEGEYHSHLLFREIPVEKRSKSDVDTLTTDSGVSFEIRTLYGVAVPIIVRHGTVTSDIALGEARIVPAQADTPQHLAVDFSRSGNGEAAAMLDVVYSGPGAEEPVQLVKPHWVRMYREVDNITKTIPLTPIQGMSGGTIKVTLTKRSGPKPSPNDVVMTQEVAY